MHFVYVATSADVQCLPGSDGSGEMGSGRTCDGQFRDSDMRTERCHVLLLFRLSSLQVVLLAQLRNNVDFIAIKFNIFPLFEKQVSNNLIKSYQ